MGAGWLGEEHTCVQAKQQYGCMAVAKVVGHQGAREAGAHSVLGVGKVWYITVQASSTTILKSCF